MGQGKHPVTGQITPRWLFSYLGARARWGRTVLLGAAEAVVLAFRCLSALSWLFLAPPPGCPALRPGSMWFNGHPGACTKAIGGRERGACGGSTETKLMLALPNWQSSLALCTGIMAYPLVESVYSFPSCRTHSLSWEALDSFLWPYTHTYIVWRSVANLLNRFSCLNPGPAGKLLRPYPPEEKDSLFFCPSFLSVANHLAYDIATTDSPPWLVFLENIRVARPVAAAASR